IARLPAAHPVAERGDLARELGAGSRWGRRGARPQRRAADQLAPIGAGGVYGHDDLTGAPLRGRRLPELQHRALRAGHHGPRLHGLTDRAPASGAGTSCWSGIRALICSSHPRTRMSIISPSGPLYFRLTLVLPGHSVQLLSSSVVHVSSMSST